MDNQISKTMDQLTLQARLIQIMELQSYLLKLREKLEKELEKYE